MTHLDDLILTEQARDYAKEYRDYHGKPEQVENRSSRNKARRKLKRDGRVEDGDGKEVDHIDGNPKNNRPSNLRAVSRRTNRVKKSMYNQAIKLYPVARALIRRAHYSPAKSETDAPNYRPTTTLDSCGDCGHFDGEQCNLFNFAADPDYVCDSWVAQDPPIGELRATVERSFVWKAGATGAMVAFFIPVNQAEIVALPDGEGPADLHITLAFLGKAAQIKDADRLKNAVWLFAKSQPPLEGEINGIGRFGNVESDGTQAFYASFDSPQLPSFRQGLVDILETLGGIEVAKNHGFTPHITLAYVPKGEAIPVQEIESVRVRFDSLSLALGDMRFDYPLEGNRQTMKAMVEMAGARNSQADLSRIQAIHDKCVELGAMCKAEENEGKPKSVPLFGISHDVKKKAQLVFRHLGGKHNQKTHANNYSSGGAIKESLRRLKDDKGAREKLKQTARKKQGGGGGSSSGEKVSGKTGVKIADKGKDTPTSPKTTKPARTTKKVDESAKGAFKVSGGAPDQRAEVDKTLAKIPRDHITDANGKSVVSEMTVLNARNANKEWEKLTGKKLVGKGNIEGFMAGKTEAVTVSARGKRPKDIHRLTAHEVAHGIFRDSAISNRSKVVQDAYKGLKDLHTKHSKSGSKKWGVSSYSRTSLSEYMSESYGFYIGDKARLKRNDPEAFKIVDRMFR